MQDLDFDYSKANSEIIVLMDQLKRAQNEEKRILYAIEALEKDCHHSFKLYAHGPYEDTYKCEFCWAEVER